MREAIRKADYCRFEFAKDWVTADTFNGNYTFKYPKSISDMYGGFIREAYWPPKIVVNNPDLQSICKNVIDNYTLAVDGDGAMGTSYRNYTVKMDGITMTLTLGFVQCGIYYDEDNDDKIKKCEKIQNDFDDNLLIEQILSTLTLKKK